MNGFKSSSRPAIAKMGSRAGSHQRRDVVPSPCLASWRCEQVGRLGVYRACLLERFEKALKATPGETMGFLREDWKDGADRKGVDAFIISRHNTLE